MDRKLVPIALLAIALVAIPSTGRALVFEVSKLWPPNSTLRVCFFSGSEKEKGLVAKTAKEWSAYGSIAFDFGAAPGYAECERTGAYHVRVAFTNGETWTFPGPEAMTHVPPENPTMSLGILGQGAIPASKGIVLHEFGHVLGFVHEQSHPKNACAEKIDFAAAARISGMPPQQLRIALGLDSDRANVFTEETDDESVMGIKLPPSFLLDPKASKGCAGQDTVALSAIDKKGMAKAYPKSTRPNLASPAQAAMTQMEAIRNPQSQSLRAFLNSRIAFDAKMLTTVGFLDSTPAAASPTDFPPDVDAEGALLLIDLSRRAIQAALDDPNRAGATFAGLYRTGDYSKCYELALEAVKTGSSDAALFLANINVEGLDRQRDFDSAQTWIRAAAQKASPDGLLLLAISYWYGIGIPAERVESVKNLELAEKSGQAIASHLLGAEFVLGRNAPPNFNRAVQFFDSGAKRGYAPSQRALAILFDQGLGVTPDRSKAREWAVKAALAGDVHAGLLDAILTAERGGTDSEVAKSVSALKALAEKGDPLSNAVVGSLYDEGQLGVAVSRKQAVTHYEKAEKFAGGAVWQRIADLLLEGGDPSERAKAVSMYRRAADSGYVTSQIKLAEFHRDGYGGEAGTTNDPASAATTPFPVPKSPAMSFAWYTIASMYGVDKEKKAALEEISRVRDRLQPTEWVMGIEFAVSRVRTKEGLLQAIASTVPTGATVALRTQLDNVISTGSGVIIGKQGQVLTNAHVVKGCHRVTVKRETPAGITTSKAKVVDPGDVDVDLALLKLDEHLGIAASIRLAAISTLDELVVLGYPAPGIRGIVHSEESGRVTALKGVMGTPLHFQTSAAINPGNSGGPIFDLNGNLMGVAVSRIDPKKLFFGINYAIRPNAITMFLDSNSIAFSYGPTTETFTAKDVTKQRLPYLVFIECHGTPKMVAANR